MIPIKTPQEIVIMTEAGRMLAQVKDVVRAYIKSGVTLKELDEIAEKEILKQGAEPAFKRVYNYKYATCININAGLVHGIPNDYEVQPGDKVSVDVGIYWRGFNVDSAFTMALPPVSHALIRFIEAGEKTLQQAIKQVRPDRRIGHISQVMQQELESAGYHPVYLFTGHGVGRNLHEDPPIPCFSPKKIEDTPQIAAGMVLAIEVIYTQGRPDIKISQDNWTAATRDGKMGGLFEETVVVSETGPIVIT